MFYKQQNDNKMKNNCSCVTKYTQSSGHLRKILKVRISAE